MTKSTIAEFVSHLNSLDMQVFVEGDRNTSLDEIRLRCSAPAGTLTAELRQELADRKAELIAYLHQEKAKDESFPPILAPADLHSADVQSRPFSTSSQTFPLSFAQQRLWFLYQLAPNNPFYNVPAAIRLTGRLDQAALEQSLREIVRRHAALRTTFTTLDGQPVQVVEPVAQVELAVVNLQTAEVSNSATGTLREPERISQQLATAEAQRPFNLTTDPLLRLTLLQFTPTESVLLLTLHHIVADGWSLGVLIRELGSLYTALVTGQTPALPPLPIQYTDFACWQREWLQGEVLEKQLAYWRKQLQDLPVLHLPADRPRPNVQTYRGATYPLQIPPTLTQALESLSQQSGISLFMTLLAAFQTLLYRYTGQEDIAIGSPIANRHRSELEGLIGFFVNSLVMRTDLSGNPTFRTLLERVRDVALEAYEHQDLPFEKLVEELDPDRDLSRNPLFQVAFALQNAPMQPLELPGLMLEPAPLESGSTRFDLEVHLWEPAHGLRSLWRSQAGLSGFISYSTDLFDRDRIGRLIEHFKTLLAGIVANPDACLSDLPLLTPTEYQQLTAWNRSPLTSPQPNGQAGGFHHIFEAQVQLAPEAIALVSEQASLTYAELNQRADRLAQTLRQMGVQPNALVGLCVDRSADMVIGILGILKAGGAYVPLDPSYPGDRLHFILTDTQVTILLTQSWLMEMLPRSQAQILCLDRDIDLDLDQEQSLEQTSVQASVQGSAPQKEGNPLAIGEQGCTADHLAYVIYTSGSTGTPKGVLLSHRGLCNVVAAQQHLFQPPRNSRVLQFSSLSFDASVFEIALALGSGGTLYIPPRSAQRPGMDLVQFLNDNAITHALLTPAVLAVLPSTQIPTLQVLVTGGEACSSQVVERWAANRRFFNAYGPTETTIWATIAELHSGDRPLTIGRPVLNTQVYILDANMNPVPAGIPGELYIGGEGLACGYLNRPELTAERFVSNPFQKNGPESPLPHSPIPTPRLYKTGDRAYYHTDGTIEFLGRIDNQIKIRGFRVELGEVEATLQRHPAIQDAVVIPSDEPSSQMRLLAYFSLNHQHFQTALRSLQTQHIQHWQALYDQTYYAPEPAQPFNVTGWNSSYTGEPIPLEQMQEWVGDRVQQILALKPKRVLEIGCGTGLLLFQIAPHCQQYVGTDFSKEALESIQTQLTSLNLPQVKLLHRMATDFADVDLSSFDVVILNSIVQYFPSQDYLIQVLEGALQAVATGGVLFLGDVRNLALLTAFHTWVQFCQADASMERRQLQQLVERSQFEEPELAIAPEFFHALPHQFPQIRQVQIQLSRGRSQNEMTQFRYNVLLHIEESQESKATQHDSIQYQNWQLEPTTVEEIQKYIVEAQPEILLITNVSNRRVNDAVKVANWLCNQDASKAVGSKTSGPKAFGPKNVGQMRVELQDFVETAIAPQDWWDLESVLPYSVEITWSPPTHTDNYDVLLVRHGIDANFNRSFDVSVNVGADKRLHTKANLPTAQRPDGAWEQHTNNPLQSHFAHQLIPELRQSLKQTLPEYMVPSAFVPLAMLPLNSSGKVDRRALPALPQRSTPSSNSANVIASPNPASLTPTETTLIDIWKDLLRLKQVNIHDNFFELGGHSLLATQMTSRVRDAFGLELPLKCVFEAPAIAQLAPILDSLCDTPLTPKIPPLVRLDRSAHRRKRSALPSNNALALPQQAQEVPPSNQQVKVSEQLLPESRPIKESRSVIEPRSPLIPLTLANGRGSKQPFFCVHPMFGVVFPYLELAHHLDSIAKQFPEGGDRSFYGLQPLGLGGESPPLNRIEAIATYYIQAMRSLQPHGPYFLGGWSFGGLVAFEMAQQLTQAGQQIGLLAILDTPAPSNKPSLLQSLKFLFGTALWSTLPFLLDYGAIVRNRLHSQNSWLSRWQWSAITRLLPEESQLQLLDESAIAPMLRIVYANAQAASQYTPQVYPNRITLFKAAEQSDAIGQDSTLGWSTFASDIQLHQVPGNHLSLLKQPHVQTLAQQLGQCLFE